MMFFRTARSFFLMIGFFLGCFLFFIFSSDNSSSHHNVQKQLSQKETDDLKTFFHYLFAENELGYTLFGDKPMSFCLFPTGALSISTKENVFKICKKGEHPLLGGLKSWNKIKRFQNTTDYLFIITEKKGMPDWVFLFNKEHFVRVFNDNIDLFRELFGSTITPDAFLEAFENKKIDVDEFFQHHLQLGVLLGYGRRNAELFHRRNLLLSGRKKIPLTIRPQLSPGFSSIEAELSFLDSRLQTAFTGESCLWRVIPVNFAADPESSETQFLRKHYWLMHKELTNVFSSENWLSLILERLCY